MRNLIPALALATTSFTALADEVGGGFTGPDGLKLVTAAEAVELPDDTLAKLQGFIVKSLGDEKYEFRDNSGTVTVEIDNDDWRGVESTPETRVELLVEVDRNWKKVEMDVESVRLVP